MLVVIPAVDVFDRRISPSFERRIKAIYTNLGMNERKTYIGFVDFDGKYGDYDGGWHEWGKRASLIKLEIAGPSLVPYRMLLWLVAHELRHVYQSGHNMFSDKEDEELMRALLKADGLTRPNFPFMMRHHDTFREEVDANGYASDVAGFDGVRWYRDRIERRKCPDPKDYRLPKKSRIFSVSS